MPDETLIETLQRKVRELSDNLENVTFTLWKKTGSDSGSIQGAKMQSVNFKTGVSGWELSPAGNLEANDGTFRGDLIIGGLSRTIDSADDIQTALDALNTAGGGTLYLKAGTWTVTTAITGYSSIAIVGISPAQTIINFATTAANLAYAGSNVYSTGTVTAASGTAVTGSGTTWTAGMAGRHLFLGTRWYQIASVTDSTHLVLAESYGDNVTLPANYRIATVIQDVLIKNVALMVSSGTAITFTDARRLQIDNVQLISNNKGIVFTNVSEVNCDRFLAVASTSNGIELTNVGLSDFESTNSFGNGGHGVVFNNVKTCSFQPMASNSNTGDGFNFTTVVDVVLFGSASANGGQGIELVSGCDSVILKDMGVSGNTSDGIKLTATSDNCRIYSCNISGNGGYGINIAASTCDTNNVFGNEFVGNSTAAASDSGTSTVIRGNVGLDDNSVSAFETAIGSVGIFSSGADGSYTLDGTQAAVASLFGKSGNIYTLLRDAYFTTLTISTGVTLETAGYAYYATVSCTINGTVQNNGSVGGNGTNGTGSAVGTGGAAGAGATGNTFDAGTGGKAGVAGTINAAGTAGTAGTSVNPSIGVNGVGGGAGGAGGSNAAGASSSGGTATGENLQFYRDAITMPYTLTAGATDIADVIRAKVKGATSGASLSTSAGAGSGGGGSCNNGVYTGGSGAGGGAGGIVFIGSPIITIGAAGNIFAKGGAGGNGGSATSGVAGGSGGGGGGAGGIIILIYGISGLTNNGTISAAGGAAGTGGSGIGGASAGADGTAGGSGNIFKLTLSL